MESVSLEALAAIEQAIKDSLSLNRKYWQVDFATTGESGEPQIFETVKHDITDSIGKAPAPTPLLWIEDKTY